MKKPILIISTLIVANHFEWINLQAIPHIGEYAKVLLIALMLMPWVARQLDA